MAYFLVMQRRRHEAHFAFISRIHTSIYRTTYNAIILCAAVRSTPSVPNVIIN